MLLTEGLTVAERFRLVRELGRGGMGSVWLAEHMTLEVLCAVKFIDREGQDTPETRQRFHREAKAAAQLRSPHVVQILDHGVWEDVPYIAMEYLEGEDLAHRLDRVKRLSAAETCRICVQVSRALTKAHAAGIVHRDLKPENIFLARDDDTEIAKVLDFGIAKRSRTDMTDLGTKTGALLGTPFYMSPEQARGTRSIDHRSDLFSLAVIAYQCLTGELPFYSEGLGDLLARIMYEPLPVPSQVAPFLPPTFDGFWARAASRDLERRFQSAKELAEALTASLRISDPLDISGAFADASHSSLAEYPSVGRVPVAPASTMLGSEVQSQAAGGKVNDPRAGTFEPFEPLPAAKPGRARLLWAAAAGALVLAGAVVWPKVTRTRAPADTRAQPLATATTLAPSPTEPAANPQEGRPAAAPAGPAGSASSSASGSMAERAPNTEGSAQTAPDSSARPAETQSHPAAAPHRHRPHKTPPPLKHDYGI